jgi:hypothetical protein
MPCLTDVVALEAIKEGSREMWGSDVRGKCLLVANGDIGHIHIVSMGDWSKKCAFLDYTVLRHVPFTFLDCFFLKRP